MVNFIINQASKIIVANEYEKKIFLEFCDEQKIEIIRNGIDLEILNYANVNFKQKYNIQNDFILFVGRFSKIKGIDILLKAINLIKNDDGFSSIKLVIMGVDFGFESEMLNMIKELKLTEKVIVIKNPSREDVISAYSTTKFLVLPSRWELSPLTPLEGFAFKKPVISTKSHGIPSTVTDQVNGILVEPENPKELSLAILDLLKDEKKCIELGNAGYRLVIDTCNSKKMAHDTLKVYENIIKQYS